MHCNIETLDIRPAKTSEAAPWATPAADGSAVSGAHEGSNLPAQHLRGDRSGRVPGTVAQGPSRIGVGEVPRHDMDMHVRHGVAEDLVIQVARSEHGLNCSRGGAHR